MTGTGFHLGLSQEQEAMREALHAIARNDLRARAAQAEEQGADLAVLQALLAGAGLAPADQLRATEPVAPHTSIVALEELAYGDPGLAWALAPALQIAAIAAPTGTAGQREALAAALSGPAATARLLAYEDFGRQPSELTTTVRADGDGWIADGAKASVAHPAGADASLLLATDGEELAAFAFTGARDGIAVTRDDRALGRIGVTAAPSGAVALSGVALAAGERLAGGLPLHRAVGRARLHLAAILVGTARASMEFCAGYALHRTTWGTPLAEHQAVSFPIIEHHTEIEEVRLLVWDIAARVDELDDVTAIERAVAHAVNRASSLALRATRDGVQLIGVRAITRDLPSERWYRSAAALAAVDFDVLQTPFSLN